MGFNITLAPLLPPTLLWSAVGVAALVVVLIAARGARGAWVRLRFHADAPVPSTGKTELQKAANEG